MSSASPKETETKKQFWADLVGQPLILLPLVTFGLYLIGLLYLDSYLSFFFADPAWFQPTAMTLLAFTHLVIIGAALVAAIYGGLIYGSLSVFAWRILYWAVWVPIVIALTLEQVRVNIGTFRNPWFPLLSACSYLLLPAGAIYLDGKIRPLRQAVTLLSSKPREEWDQNYHDLFNSVKVRMASLEKSLRVNALPRVGAVTVNTVTTIVLLASLVSFSSQLATIFAYRDLTNNAYWAVRSAEGQPVHSGEERILFSDGVRMLSAVRHQGSYRIKYEDTSTRKSYQYDFPGK